VSSCHLTPFKLACSPNSCCREEATLRGEHAVLLSEAKTADAQEEATARTEAEIARAEAEEAGEAYVPEAVQAPTGVRDALAEITTGDMALRREFL